MSFETVTIGPCTRIYAMFEIATGRVRYIGKTVATLRRRLMNHCSYAKRQQRLPVQRWIVKHGGTNGVGIKLLETVHPCGDWQSRERYWIRRHREDGCDLLNLTDGGEGALGLVRSEEHRQKISAALYKKVHFSCETCGTEFARKRCEVAKGDCRFCSRDCYWKSLKGKYRQMPARITDAGRAAAAAAKRAATHCCRGHLLSEENVYRNAGGRRVCKECRKIHKSHYLSRKGALANVD